MNEDVLGLQVSINKVLAVQVLKSEQHLGRVELSETQIELASLLDKLVQLASIHIVHQEVEGSGVLLHRCHVHNEGMTQLLLKRHLVVDMVYLFCLKNSLLGENLDCTKQQVFFKLWLSRSRVVNRILRAKLW